MNQRSYADNHTILAISPQLLDAAAAESGWIDMGAHPRLFAIAIIGATDITVDVALQQATSAAGAGAKAISGAAATQITASGDNTFVSIELEPVFLDRANGFQFVNLIITAGDGTTGAYVAGVVMAPARHAPVTQVAAYAQQVVLAG